MFHLGLKTMGTCYGYNGVDEKIMCDDEDNMMVIGDAKNKKYW